MAAGRRGKDRAARNRNTPDRLAATVVFLVAWTAATTCAGTIPAVFAADEPIDTTRVAADNDDAVHAPWRLAIGPAIGGMAVDPDMENYRWDVSPALQSGAQAIVYRNRFAAGARVWRSHTTQASGIPGESQAPRVNLTGIEVVGRARIASYRGTALWGSAQAGRLLLGYDPDQLTFQAGGAGAPVTVAYEPISEWSFGAGLGVRREIVRQMALALDVERSSFALDTAHRKGNEIVESRERFYSWHVRLEVEWLVNLD